MAVTPMTFIKNYGPGLCAYGLSAYALTWRYLPSADPKMTALTLSALASFTQGIGFLGRNLILEGKKSQQEVNFTLLLIQILSLAVLSPEFLQKAKLNTLFSQKLPSLVKAVAVSTISDGFGYIVWSLTAPHDKIPQPDSSLTWKYHASEVGCKGLASFAALHWGFKSPNSMTTALMVTLMFTIQKIVPPRLQSYFNTSKLTDPAKKHSMAQRYHLLNGCLMLITPLAIHTLGNLFLKKTSPLSEVLAMQTLSGLAFQWIKSIAQDVVTLSTC